MSRDHRKLDAFTLADEMALRVYSATVDFPKAETFGLRAQLRRAAVSTPTNVVEGCARDSTKEYVRYLEIAFGSSREVNYLIDLASRLNLLTPELAREMGDVGGRVSAALAALKKATRAKGAH